MEQLHGEEREPETQQGIASLLVIEGHQIGQEFRLDQSEHLIGRRREMEVYLDDPSISRQHARITRTERHGDSSYQYIIEDLSSTNGIKVNGKQVERSTLKDGDKVQVGVMILKFIIQDELDSRFTRRIHRLINYDSLTGLLTLETFLREMNGEIHYSLDNNLKFALAMMDIDGLKKVNDTHGHLVGRTVIREIGRTIRDVLRPGDISALYGGDEFISYLPQTSKRQALAVVESLRASVENRVFEYKNIKAKVTISIGVAEMPGDGRDAEALIQSADEALYRAKGMGGNKVCLFRRSKSPGKPSQERPVAFAESDPQARDSSTLKLTSEEL